MSRSISRLTAVVALAFLFLLLSALGQAFTLADASHDAAQSPHALGDSATGTLQGVEALPELIATLFSAIERLSYYRTPDVFPMVQRVPHSQIERDYCSGACPVVKAIYEPEKGVYIDNRLNLERSVIDRSILLHELVHHMQAVTGRYSQLSPCERREAEEGEAFAIQNAYLVKMGNATRFTFPARMYGCNRGAIEPSGPVRASYAG
jgi:hypothetical protein